MPGTLPGSGNSCASMQTVPWIWLMRLSFAWRSAKASGRYSQWIVAISPFIDFTAGREPRCFREGESAACGVRDEAECGTPAGRTNCHQSQPVKMKQEQTSPLKG